MTLHTLFQRLATTAALLLACIAPPAAAQTSEARTSAALDAIRTSPVQLRAFLRAMPKGGDLHNHLAGAVYAEDFLAWADERALCVDTTALAVTPPPCEAGRVSASGLQARDPALYGRVVDSLSMRGWLAGPPRVGGLASGHSQFFSTFGRFSAIQALEHGRSLAAAKRMAAAGNVSYLELQEVPKTMQDGMGAPGDPEFRGNDLERAYARLEPSLKQLAQQAPKDIDATEAEAKAVLRCGTARAEPGCGVQARYLCYALRTFTPAQVFRHLAQCFTLADADPRYVGVNIVAPEDDPVALRDYALHMRMFAFLATKHPKVRRTLHAGELVLGLVPPEALQSHIADAIEIAGARRIGHGVDIAFEANSTATLARMARERIAIEINLVSNDVILGVRGGDHPLALYRAAGVPITFSTDDEGVLRTDMTEQYVRAVVEHGLTYADLKTAARNSLEFAFVEDAAKTALKAKLEKDFAAFEATH